MDCLDGMKQLEDESIDAVITFAFILAARMEILKPKGRTDKYPKLAMVVKGYLLIM